MQRASWSATALLALLVACGGGVETPEGCGDALVLAPEECDDGNLEDRDGCSAQCTVESFAVCDGAAQAPEGPLRARLITAGLDAPVAAATPPRDLRRLYVAEQAGRIRVILDGTLRPQPFVDLSSEVLSGAERGLLGLAFAPQFATSRELYVNYTRRPDGASVIARLRAETADRADPGSLEPLLVIAQPAPNHNGGALAFGPKDGFLYAGFGDGGGAGDPFHNAQSLGSLLGKILRLDVGGADRYSVPESNPFVGNGAASAEIWALGLRNPWRISFDRESGDLYIADVGQSRVEEIDFQAAGSAGGENYGWNVVEGSSGCFDPPEGCDLAGLVPPVLEYATGVDGCAVVGGFVYRGCRMPWLHGAYLYTDYCRGFLRSVRVVDGVATAPRDLTAEAAPDGGFEQPTSLAQDAQGELYVLTHGGSVYQIEPR
jgi:cysteine-rich repeat protein